MFETISSLVLACLSAKARSNRSSPHRVVLNILQNFPTRGWSLVLTSLDQSRSLMLPGRRKSKLKMEILPRSPKMTCLKFFVRKAFESEVLF